VKLALAAPWPPIGAWDALGTNEGTTRELDDLAGLLGTATTMGAALAAATAGLPAALVVGGVLFGAAFVLGWMTVFPGVLTEVFGRGFDTG
jgi:hypothetical protein